MLFGNGVPEDKDQKLRLGRITVLLHVQDGIAPVVLTAAMSTEVKYEVQPLS